MQLDSILVNSELVEKFLKIYQKNHWWPALPSSTFNFFKDVYFHLILPTLLHSIWRIFKQNSFYQVAAYMVFLVVASLISFLSTNELIKNDKNFHFTENWKNSPLRRFAIKMHLHLKLSIADTNAIFPSENLKRESKIPNIKILKILQIKLFVI